MERPQIPDKLEQNPVMELMSFCQSLQLGLPMYDYMNKGSQHYCVVTLCGQRFSGSVCKTREEAAESAAGVALLQLKGGMQQQQMPHHPMMRMPGFVPPGAVAKGRQFSSPDSAFSPVNTFYTGGYQGQPQYAHGRFPQQQQQRPYGQHGRGGNRGGYGNQMGYYGNQPGNYGNQGGNYGPQAGVQHHQPSMPAGRDQPSSSVNPTVLKKKDEASVLVNPIGAGGQTEVKTPPKTQPTCVVNPFVPLQVTKKQTPTKGRKESASEDSPPSQSEEKSLAVSTSASASESRTLSRVSEPNTLNSSPISEKPVVDLPQRSKPNTRDSQHRTPPREEPVKTSENQSDSAQKGQGSTGTPGSGKKSRRRIAANFNFN